MSFAPAWWRWSGSKAGGAIVTNAIVAEATSVIRLPIHAPKFINSLATATQNNNIYSRPFSHPLKGVKRIKF